MNTDGYETLHKLKQYTVYANRVSYRDFRPSGSHISIFMEAQWLSININDVISRYKYRDLFDLMGSCLLARQVCLELSQKEIESNEMGRGYIREKRESVLHVLHALLAEMRV